MKKLIILTTMALFFINSCSLLMKNKVPKRETWKDLEYNKQCDTDKILPRLDGFYGITTLIIGIGASSAVGIVVGGIHLYSSKYGFDNSKECKKFKEYKYKQSKGYKNSK